MSFDGYYKMIYFGMIINKNINGFKMIYPK